MQRKSVGLLTGGVVAGPLFLVVVAVQDLTRAGVDPRRHPLSLLSLGESGWVQITNFVLAGLLNLAFAAGLRRAQLPGPVLIAGYGLGLIVAGVFVRDPGGGYPPGVAPPPNPSWHHVVHGLGALVVFGSLIAACGVFTRWFAAQAEFRWAIYCGATGALLLALLVATRVVGGESLLLHVAALVGWGWASILAYRLLTSRKDT